jgi:hypothetical protein
MQRRDWRAATGTYRVEGDGISADAGSGDGGRESILTRRGSKHPDEALATPNASVVVEAPVTEPPPAVTEGYPSPRDADRLASLTITEGGEGTAVASPALVNSRNGRDAGGAVPVATKVTGFPTKPDPAA